MAEIEPDAALSDVLVECDHQQVVGFTADHDDRHSTAEWIVIFARYIGKAGAAAETYGAALYPHRPVHIPAIGLASTPRLAPAVQLDAGPA